MEEFYVGQSVVVREWEDMAAEYGISNDGLAITVRPTAFIDSMRYLCGQAFTIKQVSEDGRVRLHENNDWMFSTGMFRPLDDKHDEQNHEAVILAITQLMTENHAT